MSLETTATGTGHRSNRERRSHHSHNESYWEEEEEEEDRRRLVLKTEKNEKQTLKKKSETATIKARATRRDEKKTRTISYSQTARSIRRSYSDSLEGDPVRVAGG